MHSDSALAALVAVLHSRHGRALLTIDELAAAARTLPGGAQNDPRALLHALVAGEWLATVNRNAWSLTAKAIAAITLDSHDLGLTTDEEHQLFEYLQRSSRGGTLAREDVHAVTRRFLEEVLAGADIPDELLEAIVAAYVERGTLSMSEDGGRYTITL